MGTCDQDNSNGNREVHGTDSLEVKSGTWKLK